ncbi:hypothetical protein U9R90_00850 [Streptomyces sp. E11-3]|uniref:hypothetical protein n=1 Tax=Streptomyces sp. E11-3 TaxID=3110112 RepID=UPI0039818CFD
MRGLLDFDPALVRAIDVAGPEAQRAIALLAARRACAAAGLMKLDWIAAGLTTLAEGRPLPPPLDDPAHIWRALASDPHVPNRTVGRAIPRKRPPFQPPARDDAHAPIPQPESVPQIVGPAAATVKPPSPPTPPTPQPEEATSFTVEVRLGEPDPSLRMSQPHMALPALLGAAEADPLQAALDAVYAAVATYGEDYWTLLQEVWSACQSQQDAGAARCTSIAKGAVFWEAEHEGCTVSAAPAVAVAVITLVTVTVVSLLLVDRQQRRKGERVQRQDLNAGYLNPLRLHLVENHIWSSGTPARTESASGMAEAIHFTAPNLQRNLAPGTGGPLALR